MAKFCTKCGAPATEGVNFCPKCGATIGQPTQQPTQPQQPTQSQTTQQQPTQIQQKTPPSQAYYNQTQL